LDGKCSADDTTPLENDMGGIQVYLNTSAQTIEGLEVYPNPVISGEYVHIQAGENIDQVQVFDLLGHQVRETALTDGLLDTSGLSKGIYMVKLHSAEGHQATLKLVIR